MLIAAHGPIQSNFPVLLQLQYSPWGALCEGPHYRVQCTPCCQDCINIVGFMCLNHYAIPKGWELQNTPHIHKYTHASSLHAFSPHCSCHCDQAYLRIKHQLSQSAPLKQWKIDEILLSGLSGPLWTTGDKISTQCPRTMRPALLLG